MDDKFKELRKTVREIEKRLDSMESDARKLIRNIDAFVATYSKTLEKLNISAQNESV